MDKYNKPEVNYLKWFSQDSSRFSQMSQLAHEKKALHNPLCHFILA
jgi:hypothetical protein